ncbi:hypothetical protein [Desulfopila sp. IMCC35008]|uniref:hypothetical protein n=1 Tax=Desulfopila sp. IMCC35008 TaxID=2653858 RepID=UPI0013D40F31|nr:hypothetical protein [Desulfopila sp. IMCC35008]
MKKNIYIAVGVYALLGLSGCYQPPKRVTPPPAQQQVPQQGQNSQIPATVINTQGENGAKMTQQPRYLDITDTQQLSLEDVTQDEVLPSMSYVNDRIFEYSRKLDRWKELDNQSLMVNVSQEDTEQMVRCFRSLQKVLGGYNELRESVLNMTRIPGSTGGTSRVSMGELQKKDIAFLEGPCGRLLASGEDRAAGWEQREEGADLAQLEALIARYASNKEYEEVVQVWLQIPQSQLDRVSLAARLSYANALMYLHQEEAAAEMYLQVVDQMSASKEQSTDLISLRKMLADLYTASGNFIAAEAQYKKISGDYSKVGEIEEWSQLQLSILERSLQGSPELTEYSSLLRNYLGFIPEKDGYKVVWQANKFLQSYPYSAVASNADIIKTTALARADEWLNAFLAEVDAFAGEDKYQEAVDLLGTIPDDIIDEKKQLELKARMDELMLAEAVDRETQKLAKVQELQRKWNSGMLLVKGERFDEAIDIFTEMLGTEYGAKAEEKIEEVSLLAARADRRKAADLFIRYTKTSDIEAQKKLLVESRRMLKDILVKYPEVEITEKVRGNIKRVEQEMNSIDPNLLSVADNGGSYMSTQPTDAFDIQVSPEAPVQEPSPILEVPLEN